MVRNKPITASSAANTCSCLTTVAHAAVDAQTHASNLVLSSAAAARTTAVAVDPDSSSSRPVRRSCSPMTARLRICAIAPSNCEWICGTRTTCASDSSTGGNGKPICAGVSHPVMPCASCRHASHSIRRLKRPPAAGAISDVTSTQWWLVPAATPHLLQRRQPRVVLGAGGRLLRGAGGQFLHPALKFLGVHGIQRHVLHGPQAVRRSARRRLGLQGGHCASLRCNAVRPLRGGACVHRHWQTQAEVHSACAQTLRTGPRFVRPVPVLVLKSAAPSARACRNCAAMTPLSTPITALPSRRAAASMMFACCRGAVRARNSCCVVCQGFTVAANLSRLARWTDGEMS